MRDVGEKLGFQLRCPAQIIGAFVQLGIERHNAAIGIFKLAIQQLQLLLPRAKLLQGLQQLLVLMFDFLIWIFGCPILQFCARISSAGAESNVAGATECVFAIRIVVPSGAVSMSNSSIRRRGADDAHAQDRSRIVAALQDLIQVGDPGAGVGDCHFRSSAEARARAKSDFAAPRIAKCVARDL